MRRMLIGLCLLLGAVMVPAGAAEPVKVSASTTEWASFMGGAYSPQGPAALQRWDGNFNVQATYAGTYGNTGFTPTIEAKAGGRWTTCTINWTGCVTIDVPWQTVAQTMLFADPAANTVRIQGTVNDNANLPRTVNLTFSRPSFQYNPSAALPNSWIDPATNTVYAGANYIYLGRGGYQVVGTIDGFPMAPAQPGCTMNCNYAMGPSYYRMIDAGVTANN